MSVNSSSSGSMSSMSAPPSPTNALSRNRARKRAHLPPGDHTVGGEGRSRGTSGDVEIRQLLDGVLDVNSETPYVPEPLIGRLRK